MEAVPRMPMIAFELKTSSDQVDFAPGLLAYIKDHYNENPTKYQKECSDLDQLRQSAINVSRDFMGCSTLKRYYSQLQFLQSRFPLGDGGSVAVPFTWDDVYSGKSITHVDIRYEQAAILYNIGALHSFLGAMDKRGSPEGMKVSCTHFQCASWAYQHLRENFSNSYSPDMTSDLLTFKINLMLAQAQECILEKSMTDNRKSTITAKVAAQIVEYYRQANKTLDTNEVAGIISSRRIKEWKKRLELKSQYYQSIMYLYLSNQSEEQQKWGERVAYMQASINKLEEAVKLNKGDDEEVEEALKFSNDVVGGKLAAAKKDNDFVYHEKVPDISSMPEVKGASLVKGIPFSSSDPEISGTDIFQKLVPMEAHEASSVYSEEKAKLLRDVGDAVAVKNQELEQFMSSLQLDPNSLRPQPQRVPQELLEKCAAISVRPDAIKDLVNSMQSLSGLAMDVDGNLKDIEDLIAKEKEAEKEFQESFGKRSPNSVLDELLKECQKYEEGLEKASQSNTELHKAMNTHISNLRLLSGPLEQLQEAIPAVESSRSTEDETIINEVQRLFTKVEEMKIQRQTLAEQFRQQVLQDDITSSLVTREQNSNQIVQEFFHQQLRKHDGSRGLIEQNMAAQGNILRALTEANAKYAQIRKSTNTTSQRRENMIQELIQSYDVYGDLLAKSQKGIEFYQKLDSNVTRLLDRVKRNIKVSEEERDQIIARNKPKAVAPSRPTAAKPGTIPAGIPGIPDLPAAALAYLPSTVAGQMPADIPESKIQGPTLKDYLPFMKPASFGHMGVGAGSMPYGDLSSYGNTNIHAAGSLPQIPSNTMYPSAAAGGTQPITGAQRPASWPSSQNSSPAHAPKSASPVTYPPEKPQNTKYPGSVTIPKIEDTPTLPVGYSYVEDDSDARSSSPAHTPKVSTSKPSQRVSNVPTENSQQYYNSGQYQYQQPQSYSPGQIGTSQGYNTHGYSPDASSAARHRPHVPSTIANTGQNVTKQVYPQGYHYSQQSGQQVQQQIGQNFIPPVTTAMSVAPYSQGHNYTVQGYQQPVSQVQTTVATTYYGGYGSQQNSTPSNMGKQSSNSSVNTAPEQSKHSYSTQTPPSTISGYVTQASQAPIANVASSASAQSYGSQPLQQNVAGHPGHSTYYPIQGSPGSQVAGYTQAQPAGQQQGYYQTVQTSQPQAGQSQSEHPYITTNSSQNISATINKGQYNMASYTQYSSNSQQQQQSPYSSQVNSQMYQTGQGQAVQYYTDGTIHAAQSVPISSVSSYQQGTHYPGYANTSQTSMVYSQSGSVTPITPINQSGSYSTAYQQAGTTQLPQPVGVQQPGQGGGIATPTNQSGSYSTAYQQAGTVQSQHTPGLQQQGQGGGIVTPTNQSGSYSTMYQQVGTTPSQQTQVQGLGGSITTPTSQNSSYSTTYQQAGTTQIQQPQGQGQGQYRQPPANPNQNQYGYTAGQTGQSVYTGYQTQHTAGHNTVQQGIIANTPPLQNNRTSSEGLYSQELSSLNITTGGLLPAMQPQQVNSTKPPVSPAQSQVDQASPTNFGVVQSNSGEVVKNMASSPGPQRTPQGTVSSSQLDRRGSSSTTSSLDDLLSSSPATDKGQPKDVLKPKVITEADIKRQKEEEYKNSLKSNTKDPYDDPGVLDKFVEDVERFEKLLESLVKPTLSGPSHLETLWKELSAEQEGIARNLGMAIARCYPLKNRSPDLMPYDSNRVVLSSGKDDYINASHLDDLSACCPRFISTQSPLPGTFSDYWLMVYEQGTEVIVMLGSENETGTHKNHIYWPTERGRPIQHGSIQLNLQSEKTNNCWVERIINITHKEKKQSRAVVHLQFPDWLPGGVPNSPGPVIQFIKQVHYFYIHQRNLMKPVIVHCSLGVGRTGTFCIVYFGVQEICHGCGMIDIPTFLKQLMTKRKYILNEIDQLKFCYYSVLYHAQDILMKRGILTNRASFSDKPGNSSSHQRKPSEDFILGSAGFSAVQSGVAKMWPKGSTGPQIVQNTGTNNAISETAIADQTEPQAVNSSPAMTSCGEVQRPDSGPPSGIGSPATRRSRSGSPASIQSHTSMNSAHGSGSPSNKPRSSSFTNLPPTLASLSNPNTFTIGEGEKKTTRANFDKSGNIKEQTPDPNDPLTNLDPLWTMKN